MITTHARCLCQHCMRETTSLTNTFLTRHRCSNVGIRIQFVETVWYKLLLLRILICCYTTYNLLCVLLRNIACWLRKSSRVVGWIGTSNSWCVRSINNWWCTWWKRFDGGSINLVVDTFTWIVCRYSSEWLTCCLTPVCCWYRDCSILRKRYNTVIKQRKQLKKTITNQFHSAWSYTQLHMLHMFFFDVSIKVS